MEAKLLDSLRHRLGELEHQIQARRRDLVADFQHYYRDLLHGVPPDIASSVHRALAASLSDYPTLRPELLAAESRLPETPSPAAFQPSTPSAVSGRAEAPGSPRERENELRGLFTPTYLPLLDDSFPILPRPTLAGPLGPATDVSESTLPPEIDSQGIGQGQLVGMDGIMVQGSGQGDAPERWLPPAPAFSVPTWPSNNIRSADDTRSSVSSDKSDSKPARSALRRSSSISKPPQSPRRVRFDFMGAEVLPTSSPKPSEFMDSHPESSDPSDDGGDSAFDSNLGGDTNEEEHVPPRKVSSSDALRALSRAPLESGPIWTVVNADADDVAPGRRITGAGPTDVTTPSLAPSRTMPESSRASQKGTAREYADNEQVENSDGDDSSDDGFLAMTKTRSSNKKPLLPPMPHSPVKLAQDNAGISADQTEKEVSHAHTAEEDQSLALSDDGGPEDEGDMFHFEAGGLSAPPRPRPRPTSPPAKEEEEDSDELGSKNGELNAPPADATESQISVYATSPAVHIRHAGARPSSVRFQPGSLGSYKGRPLMMPIVRDPQLLEQANAAGPPRRGLGGMDDETAMQEGSLPQFASSIPQSFSERLMMEEMMEQERSPREEKKEGNQ